MPFKQKTKFESIIDLVGLEFTIVYHFTGYIKKKTIKSLPYLLLLQYI